MSKNEVIKNAIWEIDRICKIVPRSKDMGEIRDLMDALEELRDLIRDHEELLADLEDRLLHEKMDATEA
jgi:hypothetical protein